MATLMVALPVHTGQEQAARDFAQECIGPRYDEFDASERRIGIPRENWYLLRVPAGAYFVIHVEANDLQASFGAFIQSRNSFDLWFKEQLRSFTGVDLNAGPPPAEMIAETLAEYAAK
jgi:hypothetical protein